MPATRPRIRWTRLAALATAAGLITGSLVASPAQASPPNIPDKDTAQAELNALTVRAEGSMSGYSRSKFPHWITISGTCNTRETVLKRDGTSVVVNSACTPTSGQWYSPYDGATWSSASDLDIDHVVPLAEAWRSGAKSWSKKARQRFANDLKHPQLIAVTDNVNQAKGDQDPSAWKPPLSSYWCTYAEMWIASKFAWKLTLQSSEKAALQAMLDTCPS